MSGLGGWAVPWIEPVDGWTLYEFDEWDGDGFKTPGYCAKKGDEERLLNTSRFRFLPTQERFAYLVRNDFPPSPSIGPWDNADLDLRIKGAAA